MSEWEDPKVIWLQPWCEGCQRHSGYEGRNWCDHDVWGKCDECGRKAVRYETRKTGTKAAKDKAP